MAKARAHSWEVADEFWRRVEPLDTSRVFVFDFRGFTEPSKIDFGFIPSLGLARFNGHILFAFRESQMSKFRMPYLKQSF